MIKIELHDDVIEAEMKRLGIYDKIVNTPLPNAKYPIVNYQMDENLFVYWAKNDDPMGKFMWVSWDRYSMEDLMKLALIQATLIKSSNGVISDEFTSPN